jgi:hypothetical protein
MPTINNTVKRSIHVDLAKYYLSKGNIITSILHFERDKGIL